MGQTGFFHHIGSFLLLVATVLLIVTSISAPVVHNLSMLKIYVNNDGNGGAGITLGTFGYCVIVPNANDACSGSHIGYDASSLLADTPSVGININDYSSATANGLTRVMILHPIAAAMSFIAFLLALGAGIVGSFLASLVALATFLVTLVVLVTDFVAFGILKNAVNAHSSSGASADFGAASWTLLASAICNFLATIIVFFTCCSARLHKRRNPPKSAYDAPPPARTTSRRWF